MNNCIYIRKIRRSRFIGSLSSISSSSCVLLEQNRGICRNSTSAFCRSSVPLMGYVHFSVTSNPSWWKVPRLGAASLSKSHHRAPKCWIARRWRSARLQPSGFPALIRRLRNPLRCVVLFRPEEWPLCPRFWNHLAHIRVRTLVHRLLCIFELMDDGQWCWLLQRWPGFEMKLKMHNLHIELASQWIN